MEISAVLLPAVTPVLETGLVVILARRRLHRVFPVFFWYLGASILIAGLRFAVISNYPLYFKVFWATAVLYTVLGLLVLYEVFHWVFRAFYKYWWWFWLLFPGAIVMVTGLSVWYALLYPPVQASRLISLILVFGLAVNLVQIGLFVLFFLLVWILELGWRDYAFAIVLGFAISAFGALSGYWLFSEFGTKFGTFAKYAPPVSYILAVVFWLTVFIRPEPEMRWDLKVTPEQLLDEVRRYTRILERFRKGH